MGSARDVGPEDGAGEQPRQMVCVRESAKELATRRAGLRERTMIGAIPAFWLLVLFTRQARGPSHGRGEEGLWLERAARIATPPHPPQGLLAGPCFLSAHRNGVWRVAVHWADTEVRALATRL